MVNTDQFICFNFYIVESYSINISTTITFDICADDIERLPCICYGNIGQYRIMNISLTYSKSDGIAA